MKKYILSALFLFCLSAFSFAQDKQVIDKIIAVIGNEFVLLSEIEEQHALISAEQGTPPEDARCMIMESLLATNLLLNQAKLDSIQVSESEVESQLDARIEQILLYMGGNVQQFEEYYGQTIAEVKEQFRTDLRNQLLVQRMQQTVLEGVTITPSEVKDFFSRVPSDSLPYFNSEVEIREVIYTPKVNDEEKMSAEKTAEDLRNRIVNEGEDFASLAKTYSDDKGSGSVGGDLSWQKRGTFVPEFEAAAYNLEKMEISEVVESEFGFHVIQLLDRRGNAIHTRHILIKPEITADDLELAKNKLAEVRELIVTDSITFSYAVKKYSSDKFPSYNTDGRMVNMASGDTFYQVGDLEPDIYFAIDTMKVGDISSPIEFQDRSGETMYRIIFLQSQTNPHKASLKLDYSKIKSAALDEKKNSYMSKWVQERLGDTYINITQGYLSCPNIALWNLETTP